MEGAGHGKEPGEPGDEAMHHITSYRARDSLLKLQCIGWGLECCPVGRDLRDGKRFCSLTITTSCEY